MKKISRILTLCFVTLALLCIAVPAAFAAPAVAEEQDEAVYAIGLDSAGGVSSTVVVYTNLSGRISTLPEAPTMDGYTFDGWYTEPVGGTKVTTSTVFNSDTTIYAHWTVKADASAGAGTEPAAPAQDTQPAADAPSPVQTLLKEHRGTFLVAGILVTTLVAAAAM